MDESCIANSGDAPRIHLETDVPKLNPEEWKATYAYDAQEAAAAAASLSGNLGERAFIASRDHPAIEYAKRPLNDTVSELNRKIREGTVQFKFDGEQGYLRSVLEGLNVPIESQVAVFSKTSVQSRAISPDHPRTLFFNDAVTVGWVRGGFIELAAQDPRQGVVFYTLPTVEVNQPQFARTNSCLGCHVSYDTLDVPGMLMRSVFPGSDGTALYELGRFITDHRSPFEERWGGWYVTGNPGSIRHMGNATIPDPEKPESMVTPTVNLDSYLSSDSDIIALMVFEHQMHMMNLITRVNWEVRVALDREIHTRTGSAKELTARLLDATAKEFVDYLLFVDEPPFAGRIQGASGFSEKFSTQGPRDSKGRSLRQLQLEGRLMRYPCSYMIYSAAFDGLPIEARDAIFKRMWAILSGEDKDARYARLAFADRQAIVEILRETKRDLPGYFQPIRR